MASWSRVAGWTPNAVNFIFRKGCSDLRSYYRDLVDTLEEYIDDHTLCPHYVPVGAILFATERSAF